MADPRAGMTTHILHERGFGDNVGLTRRLASPDGRTLIMGVLNVTPDSFSDGGRFRAFESALEQARRLLEEGADILDVGGESSRPGADPVPEAEELERVAPVVEVLARETDRPVSIDTYKPGVARECLRLGATIVNDVAGFRDPEMIRAAADGKASIVMMHMRGRPKTMQQDTEYVDLLGEIRAFFEDRIAAAEAAGVEEIAVDPGVGFGKTAAQNFVLLKNLGQLQSLGRPVLIGTSRKSFLGGLPSRLPVDQRLEGTIATCCAAVERGATIVRVHDVAPVKRAMEALDAVRSA